MILRAGHLWSLATWRKFAIKIVAAQVMLTDWRQAVRDHHGGISEARPSAKSVFNSLGFANTIRLRAMPWRDRRKQVVATQMAAKDRWYNERHHIGRRDWD